MIYLRWLFTQGIDLNNVETESPLGKKILRDLESIPKGQTPLASIQQFFANKDLRGQRVALEVPYDIEDLREVTRRSDSKEGGFHFWVQLADYIESKGGIPVSVDPRALYKESNNAMTQEPFVGMKRHERLSFRRSIRMVEGASFSHAAYLIVGAGHADDVRTVLGRDAHTTILAPRALRKILIPSRKALRVQWKSAKPRMRERLRARMSSARRPKH